MMIQAESHEDHRTETFGGARTILLVEDDPDLREVLALALERLGYYVRTASNGWEALKFLYSGNTPALIVCDLHMPVMTGWEFIERLSADPEIAHIPVIVLSGSANKPARMRHHGVENLEILPKPFDFGDLLVAIRPYVGWIRNPARALH